MTKEALKLALEALEEYVNVVVSVNDPNEWTPKVADAGEPARKAITAIKEALAQPEQEPVAWIYSQGTAKVASMNYVSGVRATPLYTSPPQRTWVGLTDEEVEDFVSALWPVGAGAGKLLRAIEAKLKEKNT